MPGAHSKMYLSFLNQRLIVLMAFIEVRREINSNASVMRF